MEWFEDESFWKELYPFIFSDQRFAGAADQVSKILDLVGTGGPAVLDLCCGPGLLSLPLAESGLSVTGVDKSPFLLDKARERTAAGNIDIEWVQEDMRTFLRSESFDLVVNMFTSFGYFDDKNDDMTVLANIYSSLKPAGTCLIDLMGKEILARIYQRTLSEVADDGAKLFQIHEVFDNWTRVRSEWILVKGETARTFRFHHTLYSAQELTDRLAQVGFENIEVYGDLDANPYDRNAKRLILKARK